MKNKLLVIFFIAIVFSFLIYKVFNNNKEMILVIGEYNKELLDKYNNSNLMTFLYDNLTYKELENAIINNDFIIIKDKKVYLNQLINKSSLIVFNVKDCKNSNIKKEKIKYIVNKISNAKLLFMNNCK